MLQYILLFAGSLSVCFAQNPKPADPQTSPIAIINATLHQGNGKVIEQATILFDSGWIVGVGQDLNTTGYEVQDAAGKHVYPGMIMPSTNLGLEEISAVRPTMDVREVGSITPNIRSQIAFNTDSEILPTYIFNGILIAQPTPQGGLIPGTSSIMMLDAWNWEDATLLKDDAVHIIWPAKSFGARWWRGETERRPNNQYDEQVSQLLKVLGDAKTYGMSDGSPRNLKLEALQGVYSGDKRVFVYTDRAGNIVHAVTQLKQVGIEQLVLVGGEDAFYVKDLLKQYEVPVILDEPHRMPSRVDDDYDMPFKLPGLLTKEGILVGLRHNDMLSRGRNLPYYAGTAAAYGMEKEDALKLVTSNTAKILGIDELVGTIEEGKMATFVICKGDLMDMGENVIEVAFISGREISLGAKQQLLYERFKQKYTE
ncbi:MAG: amidohydrolase family protein [Cyclobacteriaceae bacterium]